MSQGYLCSALYSSSDCFAGVLSDRQRKGVTCERAPKYGYIALVEHAEV